MIFRVVLIATLLLVHGELRAKPLPDNKGFAPNLIIYLAKGPSNSCGPGCDRWIAVEGNVDRNAASRIRRFLQDVKDTQRPIYFHSPGGSVEQAFMIGRLLRSRKAVARVGRTIVATCAAEAQIDDACLKIKTAGGEVEAEIVTRQAICNSACGYLFLGATTREVAPDATMAVHNSKFTLVVHGKPPPQLIEAATDRGLARADRERTSFVAAMGISHELIDLIKTVKFEDAHVLTRPELYRFGIDTRPIAETAWTLETGVRPYIRKVALARKDDGAAFRAMEWRLFCENKERARLMFAREFDKGAAGTSSVVMMAGSEKPVAFGAFPARIGTYEAWSGTIASTAMKAVLAAPYLQMGEGRLMPDGKTDQELFEIDTRGLEPAWMQLFASCPAAPSNARPAIASPDLTATPAQ
ncbi:MAG: hypothetical protein ACLQDM_31280 [Bradyrhizobium sp.]